jgi:enoyl-CoA hydratase
MSMATVEKPRPHVSVIRLNDPDTLNSMSFELVGALYQAIETVGADNDTYVGILTGNGRGFCSGLNLEDVGVPPGSEGLTLSRIAIRAMAYMSDLIPAMRNLPQPLIAAVNGPAYGGGLCLTLGADIRIASESATFRGAGINNGLAGTELGVSYLLPRLIGASRANEIILSGRELGALEAERIGLVSRVVPDGMLFDSALAGPLGQPRVWQPAVGDRPREPQSTAGADVDGQFERSDSRPAREAKAQLQGLTAGTRTASGSNRCA